MASSVSCLDVSDSLTLSATEEMLSSSVAGVTATPAHTQVTCHTAAYPLVTDSNFAC